MATNRGLDEAHERLFEVASLRSRVRISPKWEVEGRVTRSVKGEGTLNNDFVLRRYSHDYLIELEVGYQAGEGTDFGIAFKPLFGWKRKRWGMLQR